MDLNDEVKSDMQNSLEHLKKEFATLRTNRANTSMLENILVEVYGTKMKLKELSHITIPEPRQLLISAFDANNNPYIVKAIQEAHSHFQPIVDGNAIRINIPPMDEGMRRGIAKQAKKLSEEAKISIRDIRRKYNDIIKKEKQKGNISEDEMKRHEKKIQEMTDQFCKEIDVLFGKKEKEIMEI